MLIIIGISKVVPPIKHYYDDRQSFIDDMNINDTVEIPTFDRALQEYSQSFDRIFLVERCEDLDPLCNYSLAENFGEQVRKLANDIMDEYWP